MEAFNQKGCSLKSEPQNLAISNKLGLYKAEWLNGTLFDLFTEPGYFGELKNKRPCVLIGGRGTGKTTVLRGLSYQGQYALGHLDSKEIPKWDFYGLYHRVNTNRVTAFKGPELTTDEWIRYFSHYINLSFCSLILEFAVWYETKTGQNLELKNFDVQRFQTALGLAADSTSIQSLSEQVQISLLQFEATIKDRKSVV